MESRKVNGEREGEARAWSGSWGVWERELEGGGESGREREGRETEREEGSEQGEQVSRAA